MICQRCLRRLAGRQGTTTTTAAAARAFSRAFSAPARAASPTPVTAQTTTATNPRPHDRPAATTQAGAAQPFSAGGAAPSPASSSPPRHAKAGGGGGAAAKPLPPSSVPAGTVLKGLNFMKNKQDPVALDDSAYPPWLWTVLDTRAAGGAGGQAGAVSEGDLFSKSKKQRQRAAKALRKQALLHPEALAPKVPLSEQTIDLPAGDGTAAGAVDAGRVRHELNQAMRDKRRKKIKEDNFLSKL